MVTLFVYLSWRALREDYQINDLLLYLWSTLFMVIVGGRIAYGITHLGVWDSWWQWLLVWRIAGMAYWGSVVAVIGWTLYFCSSKKWRFYVLAEEITPFVVFLMSGMIWTDWIWGGRSFALLGWGLLTLLVLLLALLVKNRYRSFIWYPSGKKGFLFWWVLFTFGVVACGWLYYLGFDMIWIGLMVGLSLTSAGGMFILGDTFKHLSFITGRKKK